MTTTAPSARSNQPMHNFSLPFLKWGHVNTSNRCRRRSPDSDHHHSKPRNSRPKHKPTPIETASLETNNNNHHHNNNSSKVFDVDAADGDGEGEAKPWKLRPRRSPKRNSRVYSDGNETAVDTMYGRPAEEDEERNKRRKLWISLSKEEIEEDVYALTGSKPNRRPKKRNKTMQKQVDNLSPGFYLDGISPDSYRA